MTDNGVTIIGYTDLAGRLPAQASQLYGTNLVNLMKLMTPDKDGQLVLDFDDVVQRSITVVRDGELDLAAAAGPGLGGTGRRAGRRSAGQRSRRSRSRSRRRGGSRSWVSPRRCCSCWRRSRHRRCSGI